MSPAQQPSCPFCDLIHGAGEASMCYEDSDVVAFLDIQPVNAGHLLVVPREHYESLKDVSEMFVRIMELRKRRELDPTLQLLRKSLAQLEREPADDYTRERLQEMAQFFEASSEAYEQIHQLSPETWHGLLKARGKLKKLAAVLK